MKVYCCFCRFYKPAGEDSKDGIDRCLSNPGVSDTPINRKITFGHCNYKNKDNHCKEFRPTFSYWIKRLFGFYSWIEKSSYNFSNKE